MRIGRNIEKKLIEWRSRPNRKPLLLQGARQVGKTWLLKDFGQKYFKSVAYFNFEEQTELHSFFKKTKDVGRIVAFLSLIHKNPIYPQDTLIIFDEIQACNDALNALKYFQENGSEYAIAAAGSLLGVTMSRGNSFPVGKVEFMNLYPLTFSEFIAASQPDLAVFMDAWDGCDALPELFFNRLLEQFKTYFISGGMPEAVSALIGKNDVSFAQKCLEDILNAYRLDFSKYTENHLVPKITHIFNAIPSQLARENKKFVYKLVKQGARAREYEDALLWLEQAGLIYRIFRTEKPALPLVAYDDLSAFKVYLSDVGLLRRLASLDPIAIIEGNRLFTEFKGALTENFVLQSLISQWDVAPRYWNSGNKAEVDFILQFENKIIPIEVKSDKNIQSKSLRVYDEKYRPDMLVRYSLLNFKKDGNLLNIPLFLIDKTPQLVRQYFT